MAIESNAQVMETDEEIADMAEPDEMEAVAETIKLPATMLGGQSVTAGDVVRLEVVSVDEESGNVSVRYHQPKPKKEQSIQSLSAEFDDMKEE